MTPPFEEAFYETDAARLRRWLPWLYLFRGFRLATRWQNLVLAAAGLLLLTLGRWGLSQGPAGSVAGDVIWPWEVRFLSPPLPTLAEVTTGTTDARPWTLLAPALDLWRPATRLFHRGLAASEWLQAALYVLWVLAVGALIGGAITRRVACEFTGRGEPGVQESLWHAAGRFLETFTAPLISVVGMVLLTALGSLIAVLGRIPGIGEPLAALLWGGVLLLALVMALMAVGVAAAWPLTVAASSLEGSDSFDALNRAYNYLFVRPWYAAGMLLAVLVYGSLLVLFLVALVGLTLHFAQWIVAGPLPEAGLARIMADVPELIRPAAPNATVPDGSLSSLLAGAWHRGAALLLTAFVYSFFWTNAALMYLLLRKSVDATDLDRIFVPEPPRPATEPPLAGIPAVNRRPSVLPPAEQ
jgi:hypothetical protein